MASTLQKLLTTLMFSSTILHFLASSSAQECPYPCYPPPTGTGNNPPLTTTPPAGVAYSPPGFYSPPTGVLPYYPPPGYVSGLAPPPPEPILSWFPYYYRKPPHGDQSSSSTPMQGSLKTMIIITIPFLVFILCSILY